jgi:hypothetical protein
MIKKKEILKSKFIKLLFFFSFIFLSCKENNNKSIENSLSKRTDSIKNEMERKINNDDKQGFVISCGSGCAISYSEVSRKKINNKYQIKFNVKMYINENIEEEYDEIYIFEFNDINVLTKINIKGYDENLLMDNELTIINDLIKISENLIKNDTSKHNTLNNNTKISLKPYNKTIDIENVTYKIMPVNETSGLSDFACGDENIRYIPFYKKDKINIILIPMDCGDSPYRYYLISIFNNTVVSNLYVEGALYEPESINRVEKTSFSIDESSVLNVKTINKNFENGKTEVQKYEILENGEIINVL